MCKKGTQANRAVVERVKERHLERLSRTDAENVNLYADGMIVEPTERFYQGHKFIEVERPSLLVFEDQQPRQNWAHDCRFHFHDPETGKEVKTIDAYFPPDMIAPRPSLKAFHRPVIPEEPPIDLSALGEPPHLRGAMGNTRGERYAVFLSGYSDFRHINTMELWWRILIDRYGFAAENILVCNYDGQVRCRTHSEVLQTWPGDETSYRIRIAQPGTVAGYKAVLNEVGSRLRPDDFLFVMMQNHGGHDGRQSYLCAHGAEAYKAEEWGQKLAALPPCHTIYTVFQQCHSGGFIKPTIQHSPAQYTFASAACAEDRSSYGGAVWSGFSLHSAAAIGGGYPRTYPGGAALKQPVTSMPSVRETFEYAKATTFQGDTPWFAESPTGCGAQINLRHAPAECDIPATIHSSGLIHFPDRVRLGVNRCGSYVDWQPSDLPNAHIVVAGGSGQGKTQGLKTWIERRLAMDDDAEIHIFDLHGEYSDLARLVAANGSKDGVIRIDATHTGLPFGLLERHDDLPDDIRLENILADLRAAAPLLGNIQAETVRAVLAEGLRQGWNNLTLREAFESMDDPNIKAHFNPVMLLLRSESTLLHNILDLRMVLHDLTDYQDPSSRAAYVLTFLSRVIQHRFRIFQGKQEGRLRPLVMVFEEAKLLKKAQVQMQRFFQESRKLACGGVFVSQELKAVPSFVRQNSATHLLFQSAVKEDSSLRNEEYPEKTGEAVIRRGDQIDLIQLDRFYETFPEIGFEERPVLSSPKGYEKKILQRHPERRNEGINRQKSKKQRYFVPPMITKKVLKRLAPTDGSKDEYAKGWARCYCINMNDGSHLIWDNSTRQPLTSLNPVRFLDLWPKVVEELTAVLALRSGKIKKNQYASLLRKEIAFSRSGNLVLNPALNDIPQFNFPEVDLEPDPTWPEPESCDLQEQELQNIRAVATALWDLRITEAPIEVMLPVFRGLNGGGEKVAYPAWIKRPLFRFGHRLPEEITPWGMIQQSH